MGINIGVCELEAENAKCRPYKERIVKVMLKDVSGFEDVAEIEEYVTLEDAKELFPDYDAFIKRNRINEESDAIYLEKVKNESDMEILRPRSNKRFTGWVAIEGLDEGRKKTAMDNSNPDDRISGWDLVDFDSMNEMCASCPLSWDKGRGCIGAFGPENSKLPEIAEKRGCPIIASALENSKQQKRFSPKEAEALLKEIEILKVALPEEGKLYVRRYSGPLERLEAVANVSIKEGCGFLFF